MDSNTLIIIVTTSYIIGSLPYGLILLKLFYGIDVRTIGSGNIGATNVLRSGHKWMALLTLLLDSLKGAIVVLIVDYFFPSYVSFALLAVLIGHIYPIWLKFKGGKGVATFFGAILALNPIIFLISGLTWLIVAIITRYSSLSAILAVLVFPISCYFLKGYISYTPFFAESSLLITALIIYKHKDNIKRLLQGTETRISFKK